MNARDILKYGQQTVLQTIHSFPEASWETPGACGIWSVKYIIAHVASYERVLVDILTTFTRGGSTPVLNSYLELGSQFNDIELTLYPDTSGRCSVPECIRGMNGQFSVISIGISPPSPGVGTFVPLSTDACGQVIREVAPARIALFFVPLILEGPLRLHSIFL